MDRTLGLDVGDARVGVAITDPLGLTAQPLETVSRREAYSRLLALIEEKNISSIVVGLPREKDGSEGPQAKKTRKFCNKLQSLCPRDLAFLFYDERFTSKQAERILQGSKLKDKEYSAAVDRVSAVLILESHLQKK